MRSIINKIAELECKTTYAEKKNSTIGNMVHELANEKSEYENALTRRLATMESQLRTQQQKAEDAAIRAAAHAQAPKVGKKKTPSVVVPDAPLAKSAPTQSVDEKRRRLDELARQFRPSIEALFRAELEKIGIKAEQRGLTDGMFKMKMEELRNNRSQKVGSRPDFYQNRNKIENELQKRSETNLTNHRSTNRQPPSGGERSPVKSGKKRAPARPVEPPRKVGASTTLPVQNTGHSGWTSPPEQASPGKPGMASTMKPTNPPVESSVESSGWEPIERKPEAPKAMKSYSKEVVESLDVDTITERTEPGTAESSNWDSEDGTEVETKSEMSVGEEIRSKTVLERSHHIENQLSGRSSNRPTGGVDTSGFDRSAETTAADQTKMAIDELLAETENEVSEKD